MQDYYNGFYKELSRMDELGNNFAKIESFLPELDGHEKILDIGCGYGGVCHDLIKKGFHVSGVEINQEAIASLKKKNFNVIECDITKKLNIKEKFEVVLLLDILEHLFDPYLLLEESKKITSKNGYIIATIPLYFDLVDRFKIWLVFHLDNLIKCNFFIIVFFIVSCKTSVKITK